MLFIPQNSTGSICLGCPCDATGKTMADNSHTPVLADFGIVRPAGTASLDAGGSLASDAEGNVSWTYTAADTATAGAVQLICKSSGYAMLPKDLHIGFMPETPNTAQVPAALFMQSGSSRRLLIQDDDLDENNNPTFSTGGLVNATLAYDIANHRWVLGTGAGEGFPPVPIVVYGNALVGTYTDGTRTFTVSAILSVNVQTWRGVVPPAFGVEPGNAPILDPYGAMPETENTAHALPEAAPGSEGGLATAAAVAANLTAIQNIQNNTFVAANIPQELQLPTVGSQTIPIRVVFNDETGSPKNLDSGNPTVTLANQAGTDLSARLGAWTNPATGEYLIQYANSSTDANDLLDWTILGTVNSKARRYVASTQITNIIAVDFTTDDRRMLTNLNDVKPAYAPTVNSLGETAATVASGKGADAATLLTRLGTPADGHTVAGDAATAAEKTGMKLAADGLDEIPTAAPTGPATTFRGMIVQLWRRFFGKAIYDKTAGTIKTYADDGTTLITTQTASDAGNVETQGPAR